MKKTTSKILKACASLISHPLSYIYNQSLHTGIFPDCLKIAVVKPLYKKGDTTSMKNYRPISLLTVFSKALEKAMHSRLNQKMHTHNILVTEQYDFRKRISTENSAFKLKGSVLKSVNQEMHVGGIFCNLAKTFDCLNHQILFAELHLYWIRGVSADCFRSYLTKR